MDDDEEKTKSQEEEQKHSLDWLLGKESPEPVAIPMDSNVLMSR